jgi:hypothetical protein
VELVREPKTESYGTVAAFRDLYGNPWDLVEPSAVKGRTRGATGSLPRA